MSVLIYKQEEDGSVTKEIIPPELLENQLAAGWTVENPDAGKVESSSGDNEGAAENSLAALIEEARTEDIQTIERLVADLSQAKTELLTYSENAQAQRETIARLEVELSAANEVNSALESALTALEKKAEEAKEPEKK